MAEFKPGDIVWAGMSDPAGRNWKKRRVVVVVDTATLGPDDPIPVVAVTSQVPANPGPDYVLLPHGNGSPHRYTSFEKQCAAYCGWPDLVPRDKIDDERAGWIRPNYLLMILHRCAEIEERRRTQDE